MLWIWFAAFLTANGGLIKFFQKNENKFLKIILISLIIFTASFFIALNIDKRYSTEKLIGKQIDNFEIKFLLNNEILKKI